MMASMNQREYDRMMRNTVCVDFDGVCSKHNPETYRWGDPCGDEMPGAIEGIRTLRRRGWNVIICTARIDIGPVQEWFKEKGVADLVVTKEKPPAWLYVDDKGYRFTEKEGWKRLLQMFKISKGGKHRE